MCACKFVYCVHRKSISHDSIQKGINKFTHNDFAQNSFHHPKSMCTMFWDSNPDEKKKTNGIWSEIQCVIPSNMWNTAFVWLWPENGKSFTIHYKEIQFCALRDEKGEKNYYQLSNLTRWIPCIKKLLIGEEEQAIEREENTFKLHSAGCNAFISHFGKLL